MSGPRCGRRSASPACSSASPCSTCRATCRRPGIWPARRHGGRDRRAAGARACGRSAPRTTPRPTAGWNAPPACGTGRSRCSPTGRRSTTRWGSALWQAHLARTIRQVRRLRVGTPHPGLPRRDRYALRAALVVALIAAFGIAGQDAPARFARRAAADPAAAAASRPPPSCRPGSPRPPTRISRRCS